MCPKALRLSSALYPNLSSVLDVHTHTMDGLIDLTSPTSEKGGPSPKRGLDCESNLAPTKAPTNNTFDEEEDLEEDLEEG